MNPQTAIETAIRSISRIKLEQFTPDYTAQEINKVSARLRELSADEKTQALANVEAVFTAFSEAIAKDRPRAWIQPTTIQELLPYHPELLTEIETRVPGAADSFKDLKKTAENELYFHVKAELLRIPLANVTSTKTLDEFKALSPILDSDFSETIFNNRKIGGNIKNLEDLLIVVDAYESIELDKRILGDIQRADFQDKVDDQLVNYYATLVCQLDEEINFGSSDERIVARHTGINSKAVAYLRSVRETYNGENANTPKIKEKTPALDIIITSGKEDEFFDEIFKGQDTMHATVRELYNDKLESHKKGKELLASQKTVSEHERTIERNQKTIDEAYNERREAVALAQQENIDALARKETEYQTQLGDLRTAHAQELQQVRDELNAVRATSNGDGDKLRLYQQAANYIMNPAAFSALDATGQEAFYVELETKVPEAAHMLAKALLDGYKAETFDKLR